MSDDPRRDQHERHHHTTLEEIGEAVVEIERRVIRLGRMKIPLPSRRWFAIGSVATLLAIAGLFYVLTQTWVTKQIVLPRLGGLLAAKVDADRVRFHPDGTLVIENARLRAPGVKGDAAEFLSIGRLEAEVSWGALFRGAVIVDRLSLTDPVVTLSQHRETGRLNVGGLALASGKASAGAPMLPDIEVSGAAIVLSEHDNKGSVELRRFDVDGDTSGLKREGDAYEFALRETASTGVSPIRIAGRLDDTGLELKLDPVLLDQWPEGGVPARARDLWNRLNVEGSIAGATLRYDAAESTVRLRVGLDNVALTLPGDVTNGGGPRMSEVSGEMVFTTAGFDGKLRGFIADTPFEIEIDYRGFGSTAPFEAKLTVEDWWLEGEAAIFEYAPPTVRWRMESFGFPSALVDAEATLRRGEPSGETPAKIDYEASIAFERGTAAYHYFPYEFTQMSGEIRVTPEALQILRIEGVSPTGAAIAAEGVIAPPAPGAMVNLDVIADGVPVDAVLLDALGDHRRGLVKALFNQTRYEELLTAGLVMRPEEGDALRAERRSIAERGGDAARLAEIDRRLATPEFEPGGEARVEVLIRRELGEAKDWANQIVVRMAEAGIMPEQFPLPIRGEGVEIVIENEVLRLGEGRYETLRGGDATVSAVAKLGLDENGEPRPFVPTIDIQASGVPVDALIIHALPGPRDARTAEAGTSVRQILTDLQLSGELSCNAYIAPRRQGDPSLGFDVFLTLDELVSQPRARFGADRIAIDDVSGTVRVSERELRLNLTGEAWAPDAGVDVARHDAAPLDAAPRARRLGAVELAAEAIFATNASGLAEPAFSADVQASEVDLTGPYEDLVAIFSPEAAGEIAELREMRRPSGLVELASQIRSPGNGEVEVGVAMRELRGVSFDAGGERVDLGATEGSLTVRIGRENRVRFDKLSAPMSFAGSPAGDLTLDGATLIGPTETPGDGPPPRDTLDVTLRQGRFESGLVREIATTRLGDDFAGFFESIEPEGGFDLELTIESEPAAFESVATAQGENQQGENSIDEIPPRRISGEMRPTSLALTLNEERIRFDQLDGLVRFGPEGGTFSTIRGASDGWSIEAEGAWNLPPEGGVGVDADVAIDAQGFPGSLRAALPSAVGEIADDLTVTVDGLLQARETAISAVRPEGATDWAFETSGDLIFDGVGLIAGVGVEEADGRARFVARRPSPVAPVEFDVRVSGDRARVSGVQTQGLSVRAINGPADGSVLVPTIAANCHGGRLSGEARLYPIEGEEGARYEANVQLAGVGIGPTLRDLKAAGEAASDEPEPAGDRGKLDGRFGLTGRTGDRESRRGSGMIQASGGRVLELPLVLPLIEVSNLTLPTGEALDYGRASFLLEDDLVTFEDLSMFSNSVEILGFGEMQWPTREIDLRFNSRAAKRIPIVSDVLEGVRDELISTEVRGTLDEPDVQVTQFSGTRRAIDRILGETSEKDRRMQELERRARQERAEEAKVRAPRPSANAGVDGTRE